MEFPSLWSRHKIERISNDFAIKSIFKISYFIILRVIAIGGSAVYDVLCSWSFLAPVLIHPTFYFLNYVKTIVERGGVVLLFFLSIF